VTEADNCGFTGGKPALNEIGVMTELERRPGELDPLSPWGRGSG